MVKATLINGELFVDQAPPRKVPVYLPLAVFEKVKEIETGMASGKYSQSQGDDLYNTYVRPFVKLPRNHNPKTDVVEFRVKKAIRSIIVPR